MDSLPTPTRTVTTMNEYELDKLLDRLDDIEYAIKRGCQQIADAINNITVNP